MIIYLEKQAKNYDLTKRILSNFDNTQIIEIDNYKNIFDKNTNFSQEKVLILAKLSKDFLGEVPNNYSQVKNSFFFKTSLNCVFDCRYCYLKGAFRNNFQVIFVNYEDIFTSIENKINQIRNSGDKDKILFYSSDYSDILVIDNLTEFVSNFIPFFEKFENITHEIRTKSDNIKPLLNLSKIPKNTEIAFSLNPEEIINNYENLTPGLDGRILAINKLLDKGFRVGFRFIPIILCDNFEKIYSDFLDFLKVKIDFSKINSIEIGILLYTQDDYKNILKNDEDFEILYKMNEDDGYIRFEREVRNRIYKIFKEKLGNFYLCLDDISF